MHNILKEKNYKVKFLISLILKSKINKNNFGKKIRESWKKNKKKGKLEKNEKKKKGMHCGLFHSAFGCEGTVILPLTISKWCGEITVPSHQNHCGLQQ
jgi:hypothetical protein